MSIPGLTVEASSSASAAATFAKQSKVKVCNASENLTFAFVITIGYYHLIDCFHHHYHNSNTCSIQRSVHLCESKPNLRCCCPQPAGAIGGQVRVRPNLQTLSYSWLNKQKEDWTTGQAKIRLWVHIQTQILVIGRARPCHQASTWLEDSPLWLLGSAESCD